jgi:uncharacterized protein
MMHMSMGAWIIAILTMIVSWIVSSVLKSKFRTFSKIPVNYGMTGRDVAEKMLRDNGITDVSIVSTEGELSDHYNPQTKTVNLSRDVYYGNHVAAAAVAAHECGHAVQHAQAYAWLQMRTAIVPAVSFASQWMQWVLLAGVLLINTFPALLLIGIILFAATTLFSFITLPVEIDASRRALIWLNSAGITGYDTHPKAQSALRWAAYTYIVAALGSLAILIHYILLYMGRRD